MLKVELHTHTSDDPVDLIPHDATQLIDRAADLGFGALAITLHDKQFDMKKVASHARDRRMVLIPGIERTISGKHVLLLNFPQAVEQAATLDDVRRLKQRSNGLVIAPHPFFPGRSCLRGAIDRHADLFDAVELNAFYTRALDFNRRADRWARAHGKPLVGNGDVHRLSQMGTTFSLVDVPASADRDAICDAIREGRVDVRRRPITLVHAATIFGSLLVGDTRRQFGAGSDPSSPSAAALRRFTSG